MHIQTVFVLRIAPNSPSTIITTANLYIYALLFPGFWIDDSPAKKNELQLKCQFRHKDTASARIRLYRGKWKESGWGAEKTVSGIRQV